MFRRLDNSKIINSFQQNDCSIDKHTNSMTTLSVKVYQFPSEAETVLNTSPLEAAGGEDGRLIMNFLLSFCPRIEN